MTANENWKQFNECIIEQEFIENAMLDYANTTSAQLCEGRELKNGCSNFAQCPIVVGC